MVRRLREVLWVFVALLFVAPAQAAVAFPVKYSSDRHTLVDQNGVPFPILGRTAWFVTSLSAADYRTFVDDTAARGYTAIELHVVNHDPRGNHPPFNANGDAPFLKRLSGSAWTGALTYSNINTDAPDFTTPNGAYWSGVDDLLSYCESKGIVVFLFPAYVGFPNTDQGWMQEMVANGSAKMQSYGAWIATRYKNQKNLVWMMGGDNGNFNTAQTAVEAGLLNGLNSVAGQQSTLFSAEWSSGQIATAQTTFGSSMTLNGVYNWNGTISGDGLGAYARSPVIPAFLLEEPYDEEGPDGNSANPSATQPVRRFQWWGWLSTIGGYISGNGYVWPFNSGWQSHLNTPGAQDMARLNAFIGSTPWYNLVPSGLNGMRTLITSGGSSVSASDYVAAAATPQGTLLVAYIPPAHSGAITVDMAAMSGPTRARWFDPTSGAYTNIATGLSNSGSRSFTSPGNNKVGDKDWVLVLQTGAVAEPDDIDGGGKSDILWRQTSNGTVSVWLMNGGVVQSYVGGWIVPSDWVIQGVGDFDGDGKADIVWRQTSTGAVVIWLMDGGTIKSFAGGWTVPNTGPNSWVIEAVGDFNGDGKADILWRQAGTGVVSIWLMNGGTIQSYAGGWSVTADWVIQQVGDFDGDGKADIVWRNTTTGVVSIWLMGGSTIQYAGGWPVSTDWVIQKVGDFDGDGKADIVWRNTTTGVVSIWLMGGSTIQYAGGWPVSTDWVIQKVGDFDGDGKADIAWRNTTTGVVSVWLMGGQTIQYGGGWPVIPDWVIQR